MLESLLIRYGAPTLAGLKTGALFSATFPTPQEKLTALLDWNRRLLPKGLRILPLRQQHSRTLIYLYRLSALSRDLQHPAAGALLAQRGYPCPDPDRCILHLRRRLAASETFPHEIGLFLGYPPEDVLGFLRNPTACCYSGCWKVYTNPEATGLLFARFRSCTRSYAQSLSRGIGADQLAVSG